MKAVVITTPGGPEVLQLADIPDAEAGPGEVLVRVAASCVSRADAMQRQGVYPPPPGAPLHPGLTCSGTIEALGDGVQGWSLGDEVCALLAGGGYAEKVAVPAGQLMPVPKGVSLVEAASLPEVACTVWSTAVMRAGLQAGDNFLVHGGSSGIGSFAVQLAKTLGARVFTTAGTDDKLQRLQELGADVAINYKTEDFVQRCKEESGGTGVDVILDNMGGSYLGKNVDVLATDGRLFILGLQGGVSGQLDIRAMLTKRLAVM